jgi:hypothetical protein
MLFYLILLFFIIYISEPYNPNRLKILPQKYGVIFSEILLIFLSIFRFDVGFDYAGYFSMIYPNMKEIYVDRLEPIPQLIYYIADYLHSPLFVFVAFGLPTYILFFKTIHDFSVNEYESFIIFVTMFYLGSMDIIRQYLAIAIVFYGFRYIKNKSLMRYLLCCSIAYLCHRSAIVAIFIYPLYYANTLINIIGIIFMLFFKYVLYALTTTFTTYSNYLYDDLSGGKMLRFFFILILLVQILVLNIYKTDKHKQYLNLMTIPSFIPFVFESSMGIRLSLYFNVFLCLSWPALFGTKQKKLRLMALCFFIAHFVVLLWLGVNDPIKSKYSPYQLYWFADFNKLR